MGTLIHELGTATIPEEKRPAFLEDARVVAEQGGLFSRNYLTVFGKVIQLITFPNFEDEGEFIDFTYSYYEDSSWENAGIRKKDCLPYSEKMGWKQFNQAVQALYILAELYSKTPYVTGNDSYNRPVETIQWLRYVLKRDLHYSWRNHTWDVLEMEARWRLKHTDEPEIGYRFLTDYSGDEPDPAEHMQAVAVAIDPEEFLKPEEREAAAQREDGIITFSAALITLHDAIAAFKAGHVLTEDEQISFLLQFLKGIDGGTEEGRKLLKQYVGIAVSMTVLPPQISIRIIAYVYGRNFWKLWWQARDEIKNYDMQPNLPPSGSAIREMSTNIFFHVSDEDRLYWWRKDGDVEMSERIRMWLKRLQQRHAELWHTPMPGTVESWQKRFVKLLSGHPKVYCFESMFFEFIGNFTESMFCAAVILLEECADETEYRRLMAVLANKKLRYRVFMF